VNEAETRAELIDPALREAGWGVVEGSMIGAGHRLLIVHSGLFFGMSLPTTYRGNVSQNSKNSDTSPGHVARNDVW